MAHSTARRVSRKPHKDFPLTPRDDGRWCKKVRGKLVYFTGTADEALAEWLRTKDDLLAGRKPREVREGVSVNEAVNRFLAAKEALVDSGELTPRSWDDYRKTAARVKATFGATRLVIDLQSDDFESLRAAIAKGRGPGTLGNEIQRVRVLFKYCFDAGLIPAPVRYGPTFKRPSKRIMRKERAKAGPKMFEADELRRIIEAAEPTMRAMVLLGVNVGFGNHDCGSLTFEHLDLAGGWVDFPRPKTSVDRRAKLWTETVAALQAAAARRPEPKAAEHSRLVFVTKYGQSWAKETRTNPVSAEFKKLLVEIGLYRKGRGFYALRHVFETIAGASRDQVAVDHVMGHSRDDMASVYRERIDDVRLVAVTEHVRCWLFGKEVGNG